MTAFALDSLSYSGRLVQASGAPVVGPVKIRADLAYTNATGTVLCTDEISSVALSKGVFHVKIDFDCSLSGKTLTQVLSQVPAGHSVAIQITDITDGRPPKSYSFQALHALPFATVASQLVQMGANDGEFLKWNDTDKKWEAGSVSGASGGTVTNVTATSPLSVTSGATTPALTIAQANGTTSGYLSSADWNTFNNKEGTLAGGTATQYYRGDKTWQTLNSDVVPEGTTNLYFTNLRVLGLPLTGFSATNSAIVATDTVVQGFSKAQGQINAINSAAGTFLVKNSSDVITGTVNVGATGFLTITNPPSILTDATNKQYVDTGVNAKVSKAGDTMSGVLTLDDDLKIKGGSNYVTVKGNAATSASYNFVLPTTAGTNGYVLKTDGAGNLSWMDPSSVSAGSGTVDSTSIANGSIVDADVNASAAIAQSKISGLTTDLANKVSTTLANGNILVGNAGNVATAVTVSGDATLANTGMLTLKNTGTAGTYRSVTTDAQGRVTGGTNPTTLSGYGITDTLVTGVTGTAPVTVTGTTAPVVSMAAATTSVNGYLTSTDWNTFNNKQATISKTTVQDVSKLRIYGANATNYVELTAATLTADRVLNFPNSNGANGNILTTDGSGNLSWTTPPTSLAPSGSAGGDLAGTYPNPTVKNGLDVAKLSTGVIDNTEFNYLDGVTSSIQTQLSGKQASDAGLTNLAAFNTNGILVQTATDTFVGRSIAGTANRINITNGNGLGGDPTINIDTNLLPSPTGAGQWLKSTAANISAWTSLASSDITTALGFTPINKAGDSMTTGTFALSGTAALTVQNPVNLLDVANKQYVDGFGQWTKAGSDIYRSSGNVGIGITTPLYPLHIVGTGNNIVQLDQFSSDPIAPAIRTRKARGTPGAPSQILATDRLFGIYGTSYHDSGWATSNTVTIQGIATEAHTSTSQGTAIAFDTTPSGAVTRSERMRIDSTGNIGIGTSSPLTSLEVISRQGTASEHPNRAGIITRSEGTDVGGRFGAHSTGTVESPVFMGMRARGTLAAPAAVQTADSLAQFIGFGYDGTSYVTGGQARIQMAAEQNWAVGSNPTYMTFGTTGVGQVGDTERMRISSTGYVGIGTNNPIRSLHNGGREIILTENQSGLANWKKWRLYSNPDASLANKEYLNLGILNDAGSASSVDVMTFKPNGYVGIGTSAPTSVLTVDGGAGVLALKPGSLDHTYLQFFARTATPGTRSGYIGFPGAGSNNLNVYNEIAGGHIVVMPGPAGNVGIATTSPQYLLHVNGTAGINAIIGGQTNGSGNFHLDAWSSGADRSIYLNWGSGTGGAKVGNGFANYGPAYASSFNVSSDRRLKENIKPIDHALEKILKLDGVTFDWKDKKRDELEGQKIGVIAQDVEKVFPQAVRVDRGENTLPGGTKVVSYPDLVSPLIEAVKDFYNIWFNDSKKLHETVNRQAREIASIKAENAAKEKEIAELKARMDRMEKAFKTK